MVIDAVTSFVIPALSGILSLPHEADWLAACGLRHEPPSVQSHSKHRSPNSAVRRQ